MTITPPPPHKLFLRSPTSWPAPSTRSCEGWIQDVISSN